MNEVIKTGELAALAGVNIQTIRYYERRGLLKEPPRRASGYREYPRETVRIVRFVKRAQELGFTLEEITELLELREGDGMKCAEVRARATSKIDDIEKKLRDLRAMKRALEVLVASCSVPSSRRCPILEVLEDDGPARERTKRGRG
jgi:Hg(II)-responsive transcriptional regulator